MDRMTYRSVQKQGVTSLREAAPGSASNNARASGIQAFAARILAELKSTMGGDTLPIYCVMGLTLKGRPAGKVCGSVQRLAGWLAERDSEGQKPEFEVLGFGTDRNWARSQADEV